MLGLDFMIGGKDTCNVRKQFQSSFFFILKPLQGDSGGPLWVREEEGGNLPTAYLVQSVN